MLDPRNHVNCLATGDEPKLLFSSNHEIRLYGVRNRDYHPALNATIVGPVLDYDFDSRKLYYSNRTARSIMSASMNDAGGSRVLLSGVRHVDDLAYDWIHGNLYWTDSIRRTIDVISIVSDTTSWHRTLINTDLAEPKAILVDPRTPNRTLYWSDCGTRHRIERSYLDGSARQTVVESAIVCAVGLTLDYETERLYWVDSKLHCIVGYDLELRQRTVLLNTFNYLAHPVALSTFEDYLYWVDVHSESLLKISKLHGNESSSVSRVVGSLKSPTDITVFHQLRQPNATNACRLRRCSHICLPIASYIGYTCTCPNDNSTMKFSLQNDGHNCLVTRIAVPDDPSPDNNTLLDSRSLPPRHLSSTGLSAGAIIGIVVAVGASLLLCIVCLWFVRKYRRRNIKTLKFDNPVYRSKVDDDMSTVFPASSEPLNSTSMECIIQEQL